MAASPVASVVSSSDLRDALLMIKFVEIQFAETLLDIQIRAECRIVVYSCVKLKLVTNAIAWAE
jgi:hypothetical protein